MSISRERILLSAYNQIISRGYEELSSHFVNYVLHLTELPHGQKEGVGKKDLKCHFKKNPIFGSLALSLPYLPHPPTSAPPPKLNIEPKHPNSKGENFQSGNQQIILTQNTKIKCNA